MDGFNLPFVLVYEDRDDELDDEIFFLLSAIDSHNIHAERLPSVVFSNVSYGAIGFYSFGF
jgi:hypothetical protein